MSDRTVIFLLTGSVILLLAVVIYQRFVFTHGTQARLKEAAEKLAKILENQSDEKILMFTDNKVLMELDAQINQLLLDRQKIKVDFKREKTASKKMLANISHDIKTPLTVILGYLEIMRLSAPSDEMLEKVESKAKQVMTLINQFFTLAKIESGDADIEIKRVNLNEVCRENILSFYEILIQKDFIVDISIPETKIYAQADPDALGRILQNLISNVIRYGSDGKYIGVTLREDKTYAYIDVIDKGKGIEKAFADNVFDRLYTMEDSRNRSVQGNGLGLAIAKNLAERLDGRLSLDSEPGVRTVFTLKLKKAVNWSVPPKEIRKNSSRNLKS